MSKAPLRRPISVGPLVTDPLPPATDSVPVRTPPWLLPAVVAVALGPLVLTAVGLAAVALRPILPRGTEVAVGQDGGRPAEPTPADEAIVEAPTPKVIDPGEARPPLPGMPPRTTEEPAPAAEPIAAEPAKAPRCDRFGTAIDFVRAPSLAFAQAGREGKLVLVLHLAGHFEDPGFT